MGSPRGSETRQQRPDLRTSQHSKIVCFFCVLPYICKVYEVGEVEGKAYIAMQFIDGPSLQQAAGQLSIGEKAQIIRDAAQALHAAHELGIVHRDIKPATVTSDAQTAGPFRAAAKRLPGPHLAAEQTAMTRFPTSESGGGGRSGIFATV